MNASEFFAILANQYKEKPDDFVISIGDFRLLEPDSPVSITNLPLMAAVLRVTLGEVREWSQSSLEK